MSNESPSFGVIKLTRPPVRIAYGGTFPVAGMPGCSYTIGHDAVLSYDTSRLPSRVAVDIEGAGAKGRKKYDVKSIQIADEHHCLVLDPRDPAQFQLAYKILNSGRDLVFHGATFDVPVLHVIGLMELGACWKSWCTKVWASGTLPSDKGGRELFRMLAKYVGIGDGKDALAPMLKKLGKSKDAWFENTDLNTPTYLLGAVVDAIGTARLHDPIRRAFFAQLTEGHPFSKTGVTGDEAWRLVDREQITNQQQLRRQCKGYLIDFEYADEYRDTVGQEIEKLAREIEAEGVRPGHGASALAYLEKRGELPEGHPRTKPSKSFPDGQLKTDADTLEEMNHPFIKVFQQHKKAEHDAAYIDRAIEAADPGGRIHPGTNYLQAATGRSSVSGDAAFQQWTGPARQLILFDNWEEARHTIEHPVLVSDGKGGMEAPKCTCTTVKGGWSIDWSQIEPSLAAYVARDVAAIDFYEAGGKVYDYVGAAGIDVSYKETKVILLGLLYGKGAKLLASELDCSVERAKELTGLVWQALPGTEALAGRDGKLATISKQYHMIFTLSGRIVPVPAGVWPCRICNGTGKVKDKFNPGELKTCWIKECQGKGKYFQVSTHKGVNYHVQGGAYDLLAEAQVGIKEAGLSDALYLTMHDEAVIDAEARYEIEKIMQNSTSVAMDRLELLSGRRPTFRTDGAHLGERWNKA